MLPNDAFDDLGGEFRAKLRGITSTTRQTTDGSSTVTFRTARIDCDYTPGVIKRLTPGQLVAIPNVQTLGASNVFSIYEIADVFPMHYSMLNLDTSQPAAIRREFMELIENEWKSGSKSTWIEIVAAPIGYVLKETGPGIQFERRASAPLTGSPVRLLSKESVKKLICFSPPGDPDDYRLGNLLGISDGSTEFTVNIEKLLHFHVGAFAFSLDHDEPMIYKEKGQVKISEIGKVVDRLFAGTEEGRKYSNSLEVLSFDPASFEVKWTPIQYVFRHRSSEKLLKFTTRTGRNVAVTPGHSLFVLRKGRILTLPASEIALGDFLVGTRSIPNEPTSNAAINLPEFFDERGAQGLQVFAVPGSVFARLERGRVPKWRWWRWRHFHKLPLPYWNSLTRSEKNAVKLGYKGARGPLNPVLEIDNELARLLGFYVAEGNVATNEGLSYSVSFTLDKKERGIARELQRIIMKKFRVKARIRRHGENGIRLTFNSKIAALVLGETAGTGAKKKVIPEVILNSPFRVRQEFIRAWAEGDYPSSSSRRLTSDILYTLLFDHCAGAVNWIPPNDSARIGGRRIRSTGRWQFSFPRGREMKGKIRPIRRRAEPVYPALELPHSLLSLVNHPSHIKKGRLRLTGRMLAELESRLNSLMSYEGTSAKGVEEARHDGVYRIGMQTHLVREHDTIRASPALIQASNDMLQVKNILESHLGFYEVQKIEEVGPTSEFVYDVSVPHAENFLAGFGGLFCHNSGSGKSNLTSSVIRKALKVVPDLKVVIFDVSSEYGIHILDVLNDYPSKVIFTDSFAGAKKPESEYFKRHVFPESLSPLKKELEEKIKRLFDEDKVVFAPIPLAGKDAVKKFSSYGGLIEILTGSLEDKYGATQQKLLIPQVIAKIQSFISAEGLSQDDSFDAKTAKLIAEVEPLLSTLRDNSSLKMSFETLKKVVEDGGLKTNEDDPWERLPTEILSSDKDSPRVFVVNLPEAEDARAQTAEVIYEVFKKRKRNFSLTPQVLFIIDEAQEFIPQDARKGDNAFESSRAVERLLRHGRKYNLYCWISTQRIAHLNTSALQQLHSYFISTMPRPYDRQLIADSFAIDDAFMDRTLSFQNGDWLITSFKATATQNIPVFFHAENNEDILRRYLTS